MDFASVFHKTSEQMSYPLNKDELIINLKTGYDVKRVFIYHGDPFEAGILGGNEVWRGKKEEIYFKKRFKHQLWWTTTLKPEFKRCRYYFELQTEQETWYYCEDGFVTKKQLELEGKMLQSFTVPWMNPADINITPDWVNKTVWYQIFPDRFCNDALESDFLEKHAFLEKQTNVAESHRTQKDSKEITYGKKQIRPWEYRPVTNQECFGGNLEGIRKKLSYLEEMGIGGIYLNPIFEAESNHKYDTKDYKEIDASFGDKEIFQRLVEEAHQKGIRIMLDGVFNHCGRKFKPWLDVLEKGKESKYYNWFMIQKWPFDKERYDTRDGSFYSFAFHAGMPKLNTSNPEVIDYFTDICVYWVQEYDVDGIRFDVGNEVSHKFLKCIRARLKQIKPDIYLLGEIWHNASQWLLGDEYDSVMNYPLTGSIQDFFLDYSLKKEDFEYMINRCYTMYMQQSNNVLFNLLDSHDTERLMNRVKDIDMFFQQMAILFTMPGTPCIYYGTEIAMEGGPDPDCRRCMPWEEMDKPIYQERKKDITQLIHLRKKEETFRSLYFHFSNQQENERLVEYIKLDAENNKIEVLLNCTQHDINISNNTEILYSRKYKEGVLQKNGTLIRRI